MPRFLSVFTPLILVVLAALPCAAGASTKIGLAPAGYASASPADFWAGINTLYAGKAQAPLVRLDIVWSYIAPSKPVNARNPDDPAYNWALVDSAVSGASTDVEFLGTVFWTPTWASASGRRTSIPRTGTLADFLAAAQARYSGFGHPLIKTWEIWNEANNRYFLNAPGAGKAAKLQNLVTGYSKMLTQSRAALRSTASTLGLPRPTVIAGAVGGQAGFGHLTFFRALSKTPLCRGAKSKRCFDAISVHPYSPNPRVDPLGTKVRMPWVTVGNFGTFQKNVAKLWSPRKVPIWITELAWQTNPPDPYFGVSPANQSRYMRTAFNLFKTKYPSVRAVLWFLMNDEAELGRWQSGLRTVNGVNKPSWSTFRSLLK